MRKIWNNQYEQLRKIGEGASGRVMLAEGSAFKPSGGNKGDGTDPGDPQGNGAFKGIEASGTARHL